MRLRNNVSRPQIGTADVSQWGGLTNRLTRDRNQAQPSRGHHMSTSRPIGTEERCCFLCGWCSTNPDMVAHGLFQARVFGQHMVRCHRFGGQCMRGREVCDEFCTRDTWPGFTPLPEREHAEPPPPAACCCEQCTERYR